LTGNLKSDRISKKVIGRIMIPDLLAPKRITNDFAFLGQIAHHVKGIPQNHQQITLEHLPPPVDENKKKL
jgi:hypothetical protein